MRKTLLAALAALTGCFTPVAPLSSGDPDASVGPRCSAVADCPQVEGEDLCAPVKLSCRQGACVAEPLPTVWENDPGACQVAGQCDCQPLAHESCEGEFDCVSGRCAWSCRTTDCVSDRDCPEGRVCEPGADCNTGRSCVRGCHANEDCADGELCKAVDCKTCPCPGLCEPAPECGSDADCPWQTVCESTPEHHARHCIPGCRDDYNCTAGDACVPPVACPPCANCPCSGTCEPRNGCLVDEECDRGFVCARDSDCNQKCVPGCRSAADCEAGESCRERICAACGCDHGLCVAGQTDCTSDEECGPQQVCEPTSPDCATERACVVGCHEDADCGAGASCVQPDCDGCPCPGFCVALPSCTDEDRDGWVAGCEPGSCPNALGLCDCDDHDARVHPDASESCGDGLDQDCDGQVDEGCACAGRTCTHPLDCASGTEYCSAGCCAACVLTPPPLCQPEECSFAGGISEAGCQLPGSCASCCLCPAVSDPVCATNYASYQSPCEAACAGAEVLHGGACAPGEGLSCGYPGSAMEHCAPGQYCRDTCPMCDALAKRCTKIGACAQNYDCPAGLSPPGCSAGPGRWECLDQTCIFHCP